VEAFFNNVYLNALQQYSGSTSQSLSSASAVEVVLESLHDLLGDQTLLPDLFASFDCGK
jgi:hypothetical protein